MQRTRHSRDIYRTQINKLKVQLRLEREDRRILEIVTELDVIIGEVAQQAGFRFVIQPNKLYQKMLRIPLKLKIQDVVFDLLNTCLKSKITPETTNCEDLIIPTKVDLLVKCVSVLSSLAFGSLNSHEDSGVVPTIEQFALQRMYSYLSALSFKCLALWRTHYIDDVQNRRAFLTRAAELFPDESLPLDSKAWLLDYCLLCLIALPGVELADHADENAMLRCLVASFQGLQTDNILLLTTSLNFLNELDDSFVLMRDSVYEKAESFVSIEGTVLRLASLLAHPEETIQIKSIKALDTLKLVSLSPVDSMILTCGVLNEIPILLHSTDPVILYETMWLLNKTLMQNNLLHLDSFYHILPYIASHMTSPHYLIAEAAIAQLSYVMDTLAADPELGGPYIVHHPEILKSAGLHTR